LREAKPEGVQAIVDEMISKDVEMEDVADPILHESLYVKVQQNWKPNFTKPLPVGNGSSDDEGFQDDVDEEVQVTMSDEDDDDEQFDEEK